MQTSAELVERYSAPVPRYTSYPTANHFSADVGREQYLDWLGALDPAATLSLYAHIPFCSALCWYCACTTKAVRRYEPVARYVETLLTEISNVSSLTPHAATVTHVHWGGGSPSILEPRDICRLAEMMRSNYRFADGAEFAVEIDPRHLSPEQVAAFAHAGVNRVSLGVQDFDERVQSAIGREQGFELTRRSVDLFRDQGVGSVNIDLVYGLPHQTCESLERTIKDVIELAPDRIAAFGYAHLPSRVPSQRLIETAKLPGIHERFRQSALIVNLLEASGYARVGLDHFARGADKLAAEPLRRNFQGYTSDASDALIGFGASAIGQLPAGYVQNAIPVNDYARRIAEQGVATVKGIALSHDDRVRAYVIERLMCDFRLSTRDLVARFGKAANPALADATRLIGANRDGLIAATDDGFEMTEHGKPFVRTICAGFDTYFGAKAATHSVAV